MTPPQDDPGQQPAPPEALLRVVRGTPTDQELAALVVVLAARAGGSAPPAPAPVSGWSAYARNTRRPPAPGPHAWRMSARSPG